ncbi:uncharacterized protein LOC116275442 isoform X2 [Papio anubis]|uniref:uncharacterized protein LOC116275442 isoform X2 n=1 Tax=Papio anubis TaxID=9555 RepID=UPI0012AD76DE|nr:uncharacterized protein LOC116275442 isoform X2 [Papio anubis]
MASRRHQPPTRPWEGRRNSLSAAWPPVHAPLLCFGSCTEKEEELFLALRSCHPTGDTQPRVEKRIGTWLQANLQPKVGYTLAPGHTDPSSLTQITAPRKLVPHALILTDFATWSQQTISGMQGTSKQ